MAGKKGSEGKNQGEIPGTERESDPELDAAVQDVYTLTSKRTRAAEKEKLAREKLEALMREKSISAYVYIDGDLRLNVKIKRSEKVSVKKAKLLAGQG